MSEDYTQFTEAERESCYDKIAALTAERDRYREFVEHVLVATMDGTYAQLDTPAMLDQLQCSAAEVVGEERFGELFDHVNREE